MSLFTLLLLPLLSLCAWAQQPSTEGIYNLVQRLLPHHVESFDFSLVGEKNATVNDVYTVSSVTDGKILVEGNSVSALAVG